MSFKPLMLEEEVHVSGDFRDF